MRAHQYDNATAAVATAGILKHRGFDRITIQSVVRGLESAFMPGRFQIMMRRRSDDSAAPENDAPSTSGASEAGTAQPRPATAPARAPWFVLDGAHTPESARALANTLRGVFPSNPVALVMAMADDKDHRCGVGADIQT